MTTMEELMQAALAANPEQRATALRILLGGSPTPVRKDTEPFLTLVECARRLNVSACSLWRWGVPRHQLGGRPKYRMSEIEAYLGSAEFEARAAELREADRKRRREKESR